MSWPKLEDNVKAIDVYRGSNPRDNLSNRELGRIDFAELASQNPEIKLVISRISGGWSGPDPDFGYNYDESETSGFRASGYVNSNPGKSISDLMAWWKPTIGDRDMKMIILASELTSGQSKAKITTHVQDCHKAIKDQWPDALVVLQYTAAWWWNPNIVHGWEGDLIAWLAHYPFFTQDESDGAWIQAESFEDVDDNLPISNNFTPRVPEGITPEKVGAWQFSEKGMIDPITKMPKGTPRVDLNYVKKWLFNMAYGIIEPIEPPPNTAGFMRAKAKELDIIAAELRVEADKL